MRQELQDLQELVYDHLCVLKIIDGERGYLRTKDLLRSEICNTIEGHLDDKMVDFIRSVNWGSEYIVEIHFYEADTVYLNLEDLESFDSDKAFLF